MQYYIYTHIVQVCAISYDLVKGRALVATPFTLPLAPSQRNDLEIDPSVCGCRQVEVASSKEVATKSIYLEQTVSVITKVPVEDGFKLTPTQLKAHLKKATKQVRLWVTENEKLAASKLKLERQAESLQARNEVLPAECASKKAAAEVRKLELKYQIE